MPSVRTLERKIGNLEGFNVRFLHPDGSDVWSDMVIGPSYPFERAAKGTINVTTWREQRFAQTFAGFSCEVLDSDGHVCHGGTLVSNVRESYNE